MLGADELQWIAGAAAWGSTLLACIWHFQRQYDRMAAEVERRVLIEHRLKAGEQKFEAHESFDRLLGKRLEDILKDVQDCRERLIRLEALANGD